MVFGLQSYPPCLGKGLWSLAPPLLTLSMSPPGRVMGQVHPPVTLEAPL